MPDLDDLHSALALLADRVPDEPDTPLIDAALAHARSGDLVPIERARPRRHLLAVVVAAAAIVVIAIGATVFTRSSGHDRSVGQSASPAPTASGTSTATTPSTTPSTTPVAPSRYDFGIPVPAAGASVPLRLDYRLSAVPGFTFAPLEANRLFQSEEIRINALHLPKNQDVPPGGELYVFYRGVFDASQVPHLSAVSVNDHRGWVTRTVPPTEIDPQGDADGGKTDGVVWEYAQDSWALLLIDGTAYRAIGKNTRTQNLALAEAVHAGVQTLRLPARVTGLPAGVYADGATSGTSTAANGRRRATSSLGLGDGGPRASDATAAYSIGSALQLTVSTTVGELTCPTCTTVKAGTYTAHVSYDHGRASEIDATVGPDSITLSVAPNHLGHYNAGQLAQILGRVSLAKDVTDPSTWFDAQDSAP